MPWKAFHRGAEWCVFKLGADDVATGDSLGCHDTRAKANSQVAALNINVEEAGMNETMLESTKLEIDGESVTLADLVTDYKERHHHEWDGEGPNVEDMDVHGGALSAGDQVPGQTGIKSSSKHAFLGGEADGRDSRRRISSETRVVRDCSNSPPACFRSGATPLWRHPRVGCPPFKVFVFCVRTVSLCS